MLNYTLRRLLFAIPTLLVISFIIFLILDLAPGDPTGSLPLTIPAEVRAKIREALGVGEPDNIEALVAQEVSELVGQPRNPDSVEHFQHNPVLGGFLARILKFGSQRYSQQPGAVGQLLTGEGKLHPGAG